MNKTNQFLFLSSLITTNNKFCKSRFPLTKPNNLFVSHFVKQRVFLSKNHLDNRECAPAVVRVLGCEKTEMHFKWWHIQIILEKVANFKFVIGKLGNMPFQPMWNVLEGSVGFCYYCFTIPHCSYKFYFLFSRFD